MGLGVGEYAMQAKIEKKKSIEKDASDQMAVDPPSGPSLQALVDKAVGGKVKALEAKFSKLSVASGNEDRFAHLEVLPESARRRRRAPMIGCKWPAVRIPHFVNMPSARAVRSCKRVGGEVTTMPPSLQCTLAIRGCRT
ncbi:hypothetical protein NUW54_g10920 [Trametes sanguinea]|uniref:Uncharacterized protein n=1 Tax=Trametes sanguinea TaxID=158606 RepID=A0ACC1NR63_9APHY|nr:hypothetical protein NUW54_g10920 [Trametes sanguinea]